MRHAENERADRFAVEAMLRLVDQLEQTDGLGRFRWRLGSVGPERTRQLTLQPGAPFGGSRRRRLARVPRPPHRGEGDVHARRVVTDVEPEGREPERLDFPAHRSNQQLGAAPATPRHEPGLEGAQIADQLVGRAIGHRIGGGVASFRAGERGVELPQHAGHELPIDLARVALHDLLGVSGRRQRPGESLAELWGHRGRPLGDTQGAQQVGDALAIASQAGDAVVEQGTTRDLVRDEGIAVSVAADPRAELEERRHVEGFGRVRLPQRTLELVHQLGHDLEEVFVDEVQTPGQLLLDGGLHEAQLAREPQQLDFGPEGFDQGAAFPGSPAGGLEIHQPTINASMLLEHRDALGFGRMRGDDRAHPQAGDHAAHFVRRDPAPRRRGDDLGERAAQLIVPSLDLALAPLPHGGVLLGDRQ